MRILIGNHIDDSIRLRGDMRAWTQRLLWFARDGDLVVLPTWPDPQFVAYVTALTGVDAATLRFHVPPPGRYGHQVMDPQSLTEAAFLTAVSAEIGSEEVAEVFALWPSAQVAHMAEALGVAERLPGAGFIAQGGGELVNNKANFRALAAGGSVPTVAGAVCHSCSEAIAATERLLAGTGAVVVKQAHNGAGVGNQIVMRDHTMTVGHAGARHTHFLTAEPRAVDAFWEQRWDWASAEGRFPVVVEEFRPGAVSLYAEYHVTDAGIRPTEAGTLVYSQGRLSHQIVPMREHPHVRARLVETGARLAETYRAVGYRGYLSADALVDAEDRLLFTEVNAQVSGSLHIYDVIAHAIVETAASPQRSVVEYHVPPHWAVPGFAEFLQALEGAACGYDPTARTGVIVSMPVIPLQLGKAPFVFCIAYASEDQHHTILNRLENQFATGPAPVAAGSEQQPAGGAAKGRT